MSWANIAARAADLPAPPAAAALPSRGRLIIMRGLPGTGKTTAAEETCAAERAAGRTVARLATWDLIAPPGAGFPAAFEAADVPAAHQQNVERAAEAMAGKIDTVIIDNVNIEDYEAQPYVRLADRHRYAVAIHDVGEGCTDVDMLLRPEFNVHMVSHGAMERMAKRYNSTGPLTADRIRRAKVWGMPKY